ncbi:ABC transporter substrate-binding protein [Alphaproteobacteria bacterium]|jgi:branched-chain amino acid transport system substrate-binding protein|nr:ABC transporter substrate-binding protein [Alphaproteobacteria bacterium]
MKFFKPLMLGAAMSMLAMSGAIAAETLKLGHIVARTGPLKGPGLPATVAVDIAVAEINAAGGVDGKMIEIIEFDSGSDPKQASLAARTLATDHDVLAIIGPFSSGEAKVAFNVAEREKIVMMSNASSAPGLTDGKEWAWRITEDEGKQFSRLLKTLTKMDVPRNKVDIVYVSDEAISAVVGKFLYPALLKAFDIEHGEPVAITYKSFDLAPQIAPIVANNPDMVAVAGLPENASKTIRELTRQGYKGRMIGSQIFADPNIIELFGDMAEGTTFMAGFHADSSPAATAFNTKFMAEANKRGINKLGAHHTDAQSYDAVYLFAQVMKDAAISGDAGKVEDERLAIREGLRTANFSGVLGQNLCFAGTDAELPGYVIQIKDGKWTLIDSHTADDCN